MNSIKLLQFQGPATVHVGSLSLCYHLLQLTSYTIHPRVTLLLDDQYLLLPNDKHTLLYLKNGLSFSIALCLFVLMILVVFSFFFSSHLYFSLALSFSGQFLLPPCLHIRQIVLGSSFMGQISCHSVFFLFLSVAYIYPLLSPSEPNRLVLDFTLYDKIFPGTS